jgi:glycosidase
VYYGDEIGMDGEQDPYCRKAFPWDESEWDQDLRSYVRDLITLRKQNPVLRRGDFKRLWSADGVYVFSRSLDGKAFVVALNASELPQQVEVGYEAGKNPQVLFGTMSELSLHDGQLKFVVPARSGLLLC